MSVVVVGPLAVVCGLGAAGSADCTDQTIQSAVDGGAADIEIRGAVSVGAPVVVERPIAFHAGLPSATILPSPIAGFVFEVYPGGSGTTFDGLTVQGDVHVHPLAGGFLQVVGAQVSVTDAEVSDVVGGPVFQVDSGGVLTLTNPTLYGCTANPAAAPIVVEQATLVLIGGSVSQSHGATAQAISADGSVLSLEGTVLTGITASPLLTLSACTSTLTGVSASGTGASISAQAGALTVSGGDYTAWSGAAIAAVGVQTVVVDGASVESYLAAISLDQVGSATVRGATFAGYYGFGRAIDATGVPALDVDGSWFCSLNADVPAVSLVGGCDAGCIVSRSVFQGVHATGSGSAVVDADVGALTLDHDTFYGNTAKLGSEVFVGPTGTLTASHVLFVDSTSGTVIGATPALLEYDAFVRTPMGQLPYDPLVRRVDELQFVGAHAPCGVAVIPDPRNTDPWILDNDIGAEPTCHTTETPDDGLDEDCDGTELCPSDLDGDGYAGDEIGPVSLGQATIQPRPMTCPALTPGDCDDGDPDIHPDAPDPWYDGVDQDCAGNDDRDQDGDGIPAARDCDDRDPEVATCVSALGGGSCSTAPVGALGWAALGLGFARRGRRL